MIVYNNFEWDVREASACRVRHGVSFKEATTVLDGENVTISEDPVSGACRAVGPTSRGQVLVVLYKRGPRIRILDATPTKPARSAPPAEPAETEPEAARKPTSESSASAPAEETPAVAAGATVSPEPEGTSAADAEARDEAPVSAPPASEPAASSRRGSQARAATGPVSKAPASDSPPSSSGWDAETYEIYWNAYSAVRKAARDQGKNPREAQRLGREAGERAVRGEEPAPSAPPPSSPAPKSSGGSASWRAAARAAKPVR